MRRDRRVDVVLMVYAGLVLAFILAPFVSTILLSFNGAGHSGLPWDGFSLTWYQAIFADPAVLRSLRNTLVVAVATSVLATLAGFAAAYVDYRYRFIGRTTYWVLAVLPATVPAVALGFALLGYLSRLGIAGTIAAVIVGHVVIAAPFATALIRLRLAELDADLEAAAWNLGADEWRTLLQVIVPFCRPAILASLAIAAAVSFDEFMIAWFVSGAHETLPVRILAMLQGQADPRVDAIGGVVFLVGFALLAAASVAIGAQARHRRGDADR